MKNNILSISRLFVLAKYHFLISGRQTLVCFLLCVAAFLAFFSLLVFSNPQLYVQLNQYNSFLIFYVVLLIGGSVYADSQFAVLKKRKENGIYLSLPASVLEKLLIAVFYAVVVFFTITVASFYCIGLLSEMLLKAQTGLSIYPDNIFSDEYIFIIPIFGLFQFAFLSGSVFFNRYALLKTFGIMLLIFYLLKYFNINLIDLLNPEGFYNNSAQHFNGNISIGLKRTLYYILIIIAPAVLLLSAYVGLKQTELKNQ